MGLPTPRGRGDLGSNPQLKHAIANCSQTVSPMQPWAVANTNEESAIQLFPKLVSFFCFDLEQFCYVSLTITRGKPSSEDKMWTPKPIQTICEQRLVSKAIRASYPDNTGACKTITIYKLRTLILYTHITVQKRSLSWPQDLDGETRVVELYVVNDHSQVSSVPLLYFCSMHNFRS